MSPRTPRKKTRTFKSYAVTVTTTGKATVIVNAENEEDAKIRVFLGEGDDSHHEWEYDDVTSVTENT